MSDAWDKTEPVTNWENLKTALEKARFNQKAKEVLEGPLGAANRTAVAVQGGTMMLSPLARALGMNPLADKMNRVSESIGQAVAERDEESYLPAPIMRAARGVASQVPGMIGSAAVAGPIGPIALATSSEASQAYTQAKDAGLSETESLRHAGTKAAIEGLITGAFQGFGAGGVESLASQFARGALAGSSVKEVAKQGLKTIAQELPEELMIEALNAVEEYGSGLDPEAISPEQLATRAMDTALQTLGMTATIQGIHAGQSVINRGSVAPPSLPADPASASVTPETVTPEGGEDETSSGQTGTLRPEGVSEEDAKRLEANGIIFKRTKNGWTATGLPKEIADGLAVDYKGRSQGGGTYFFAEDPTEGIIDAASEVEEEARLDAEAAARGRVRTSIGDLTIEENEWYENERQQRLEVRRQQVEERNSAVDELLGQFVPKNRRAGFKQQLLSARERGDSNTIQAFDEMVEYVQNHPELGLPDNEADLFEMLTSESFTLDEQEALYEIDDELASELENIFGDDSFDFGGNTDETLTTEGDEESDPQQPEGGDPRSESAGQTSTSSQPTPQSPAAAGGEPTSFETGDDPSTSPESASSESDTTSVGASDQSQGQTDTTPAGDTRGQGVQYHGARGEVTLNDEGYYNADNIYGGSQTFYTTDAKDIAKGYGRKNANAKVYRVNEKKMVRFYDMEQPIKDPISFAKLFGTDSRGKPDDIVVDAIELLKDSGKETPNLREIMDEIRAESQNYGMSKDAVQELFDTATYNLQQQGFGGMSHIGGLRTNRLAHTVKIYFDPTNQLSLEDETDAEREPSVSSDFTDDELDAVMDDIMAELEESPAEPRAKVQKAAKKAKKRIGRQPKKSEQTKAKAQSKREQAKQAMQDAFNRTKGQTPVGIDPLIARDFANAAKLYIEAGALDFQAFVQNLVEDFGASRVEENDRYIESAWRVAVKRGWTDSPAGKVADVLADDMPSVAYPDGSEYRKWKSRRHRNGDAPTSYLSGHSSAQVREAAKSNPGLGLLITPQTKQYVGHAGDYSHVGIDNGVFSEFTGTEPFNEAKFFSLLDSVRDAGLADKVVFAVVPDKVGDWRGTQERWEQYSDRVREYGMPIAYVAQDGIESNLKEIPWDDFDVLFIGGSTPWKLGYNPEGNYKDINRPTDKELRSAGLLRERIELVKEAKRRGKTVHMGRVNSFKRMELAHYGEQMDSTDGNYIGKGPNKNLPIVLDWLEFTGGERFTNETNDSRREAEQGYGTLESPDRVALGKHFQQQFETGKQYGSITEARKEAAALITGDANTKSTIKPGTLAAKALDEAVEQGVVRAAREFAESSSDPLAVYDRMLELYQQQPRLAVRTGTSMRDQAYSTPAPMAWVANMLAGGNRETNTYDSSAGNGIMLLGTELENAYTNEINPDRAEALRELGYNVNEGDATKYSPSQKFPRVIINPPFGKHPDGGTWSVAGISTPEIDHAVTLKTLETMPDDGKAVIVIGSKGFEKRQPKPELERATAYKNQKNFYDAIYDNYNVVDHFTLHGDMYAKQGAEFPIDMIVVDGKGQSQLPKPYEVDRQNAVPRVVNSWEALKDVAEQYVDTGTSRPDDLSNEPVSDNMDQFSGLLEGQSGGTGRAGTRTDADARGSSQLPSGRGSGRADTGRDSQQSAVSESSDESQSGRSSDVSDEGRADRGSRASGRSTRVDRSSDDGVEKAGTEFQVPYKKQSASYTVETLVPRTQAKAVRQALETAEERYGNLDEFVASELGYTLDEAMTYFSGEQMDAIALGIARHKEGKAFVLGDQTGVGKGRVAAAMMVYAKRQGFVPVFMTEKPTLYKDMYRDLMGIGQHSETKRFNALATNELSGKDKIELPDGTVFQQPKAYVENALTGLQRSVAAGKGMGVDVTYTVDTDKDGKPLGVTAKGKPKTRRVKERREFDAVFTTYAQMQTVGGGKTGTRHEVLDSIAPNAFFILDESHKAGGAEVDNWQSEDAPEKASQRIRRLLSESAGVAFLSATFAKRPDLMDLYAKTGIDESIEGSSEDLINAIRNGGVPLQQVLSEMMVESGAYMRREKSYEGIEFNVEVAETGTEEAEEVAAIFAAIDKLDRIKEQVIRQEDFRRFLIAKGLEVGIDVSTGRAGMESSNFSSIVHNFVDHMLLSLKADATADAVIASLKRGETPFVALSKTAGAALNNYLEMFPANVGDEIDFNFNSTTTRYLERSREVRLVERDERGKPINSRQVRIPDHLLGDAGLQAYEYAQQLIGQFAATLPASPIDHIRKRITDAGYSVAEITGRDQIVEYQDDGSMRLAKRPQEEIGSGGQTQIVSRYNNGTLDALIGNVSAATGLSAHASQDNPPAGQKRRRMIIAQADPNIDTFMQMLGRINRTGQVKEREVDGKMQTNLPVYTYLMTNVPAETRPASVLLKKLASLNANVTADSKGAVSFDAPDVLNVVGDKIVAEYVAENPDLNAALNSPVDVNPEGAPRVVQDIARKVSGRMAMRPVQEQKEFWSSVTETYNEEIEQLNKLGKNPLSAAKVDMGAELIARVEIFPGDPDADSPFLRPAYADLVRAKKQGEPMKPKEVQEKIAEFYDGEMPSEREVGQWVAEQVRTAQKAVDAALERQLAKIVKPEAQQRARGQAESTKRLLSYKISRMAPGNLVEVAEVQDEGNFSASIPGVVIDLKVKPGKEHLLTGWIATVALSSPDRVLRIPLRRVDNLANSSPGEIYLNPRGRMAQKSDYEFWQEPGESYEERVIGTGNVLAAVDKLVSDYDRGNVVFYTDAKGESNRGVLMPRSFDIDKWNEKRPVRFEDPQHVVEYLQADSKNRVFDPTYTLGVFLQDGGLTISAPRSRQKGGKWTTNAELLRASGQDFVSVGSMMRMTVPRNKWQSTIAAIQNISPLVTTINKESAREITGQQVSQVKPKPPRNDRQDDGGTSNIRTQRIGRQPTTDRMSASNVLPKADQANKGTPQAYSSAPFSKTPAETTEGKKLLKQMQNDSKKRAVGPRSVINFLMSTVNVTSIQGKSQLSRRSPGHYRSREHVIRSRTGVSGFIDTHEAGHAVSALMRDVNPKFLKKHQSALIALARMQGSFASAMTAEEGMAEFIRRYIVDYQSLPASLVSDIEADMETLVPEVAQGLRDTNRLWQQFLSRPLQERLDASKNDRGKKRFGRSDIASGAYRALYNLIGGDVATHKLRRTLERPLFKFSRELGKKFRELTTDTEADIDNAYQSVVRIPVEVQRAIAGDTRGRQGVRIIASRDDMLSEKDIAFLRVGGFNVPELKHGEPAYLTNQSFEQIRRKLGKDWAEFENYGQLRASLERAEKRGHESAWMHENLSKHEAREEVDRLERENPKWVEHFDEVTEYFDALLLVAVFSGEYTPAEAVRIRNAWESYWPLLRQTTDEERLRGSAGADPSAGIHRAFGSALPLRNLMEAVEFRTKAAMQAYYTNELMLAVREYSNVLNDLDGAPFGIRKGGAQIMLRLKMDRKKVATLSPNEQADMIVEYLNEQMRELRGEEFTPDDMLAAEDVAIALPWRPIFRPTRPGAVRVIGLTEKGERKYYQVTDPLLFDLFTNIGSMSRYSSWLGRFAAKGIEPWKRALTQNLLFAMRNIPRDAVTAMTMGDDKASLVPGAYLAYGIVGRLNGETKRDAPARAELFSRTIQNLHKPQHNTFWNSFADAATEGILIPGYRDMSFLDRISEAPGQVSAAMLWPVTMFNWATGGRYIAQASEELAREGAFRQARKSGRSYAYAQRQYDQISGNFSQRQPNHAVATFVRSAGFLNPGLQIMWGQFKRWTDPDPEMAKFHLTAKMPAIAAWFSVASAINVALIYALYGDDEEKLEEVLSDLRERKDYEKDTTMAIMGKVRMPFEYGLSGAVASFAWNSTEDALIGGSSQKIPERLESFLNKAAQIPGPTDAIQPYLKTAIELSLGETGYSFYRDDGVVPEHLIVQYPMNPEMRAQEDTPELYKWVGEKLNVSPIKVEYAIGSLLTRSAKDMIKVADTMSQGKSLKPEDMPVLSGLLQKPSIGFRSQSVKKLRDASKEVEALRVKLAKSDNEELRLKYIDLHEASIAYGVVADMKEVIDEELEANEPNRDRVEQLERDLTKFARQFINYQAGKAEEPQELKKAKVMHAGRVAYDGSSPSYDGNLKREAELYGYDSSTLKSALLKYWSTRYGSARSGGRYKAAVVQRMLKINQAFAD